MYHYKIYFIVLLIITQYASQSTNYNAIDDPVFSTEEYTIKLYRGISNDLFEYPSKRNKLVGFLLDSFSRYPGDRDVIITILDNAFSHGILKKLSYQNNKKVLSLYRVIVGDTQILHYTMGIIPNMLTPRRKRLYIAWKMIKNTEGNDRQWLAAIMLMDGMIEPDEDLNTIRGYCDNEGIFDLLSYYIINENSI